VSWDGWGAVVSRDLRGMTQPIDLMPLVADAMAALRKLIEFMVRAEAAALAKDAQMVMTAAARLNCAQPNSAPVLLRAYWDGSTFDSMSPLPLPTAFAAETIRIAEGQP